MEKKNGRATLGVITAMLIFATIGIFREYTPLPSGLLAMSRGLIGAGFLFLITLFSKKQADQKVSKKSFVMLAISGIMIGINWILLFEAFIYTTVPIATLSYYMAPIFVIFGASVVLGEKLTPTKIVCAFVAFLGLVLVAFGSDNGGAQTGKNHPLGIILGVGAAALYAGDIIINKVVDGVTSEKRTLIQLFAAGLVCIPYTLFAEDVASVKFTALSVVLLLVMGIFHTGVAYTVYFGSMKKLRAGTVALLSYIDPVGSVILALLFIKGSALTAMGWVGAVLVLGAAVVSEMKKE